MSQEIIKDGDLNTLLREEEGKFKSEMKLRNLLNLLESIRKDGIFDSGTTVEEMIRQLPKLDLADNAGEKVDYADLYATIRDFLRVRELKNEDTFIELKMRFLDKIGEKEQMMDRDEAERREVAKEWHEE